MTRVDMDQKLEARARHPRHNDNPVEVLRVWNARVQCAAEIEKSRPALGKAPTGAPTRREKRQTS